MPGRWPSLGLLWAGAADGLLPGWVAALAALVPVAALAALFADTRRRGWHDRMAGAVVVADTRYDSPGEEGHASYFDTRILR